MKNAVFIFLASLLCCFVNPVSAAASPVSPKPVIAVLIGGQGAIRSNEKALKNIHEALAVKFPAAEYQLVIDDQLQHDILVFTEDEDVEDIMQIKRSQFARFGKARGFDYVISLLFGLGHGRAGVELWTASYKIDVDLQAKVVDVASGQYMYRQNIMGHGSSSAAVGMPSSVNAFAKAVKEDTGVPSYQMDYFKGE